MRLDHLDLWPADIGTRGPMQAAEVRFVYQIAVENSHPARAQARQQHHRRAAGGAGADDADAQRREILVQRWAEGERLSVEGLGRVAAEPSVIMQAHAIADDPDHVEGQGLRLLAQTRPASWPSRVVSTLRNGVSRPFRLRTSFGH